MYCKNCGKEIIEGAQFCNNCGYKVTDVSPQKDKSNVKGSFGKKTPYIILAVIVVIVTLVIYIAKNIGSGSGSEKAVSKSLNVGDTVCFGKYEQDNNTENGPEDILWDVIATEDNQYMLLSHYVIEYMPYDSYSKPNWYASQLHTWLNSFFSLDAFSDEERSMLARDISLLSLDDIKRYMEPESMDMGRMVYYSGKLACSPTEYASSLGVKTISYSELTSDDSPYNTELFKSVEADISKECKDNVAEGWLLRDTSGDPTREYMVYEVRYVIAEDDMYAADYCGIRPVIWIQVQ